MINRIKKRVLLGILSIVFTMAVANQSWAETIEVEAYSGKPLGVGSITVNFEANSRNYLDYKSFWLKEGKNRALYPCFDRSVSFANGSDSNQTDKTVSVTAYFLFTGDQPLDLKLIVDNRKQYQKTVKIQSSKIAHKKLLDHWWRRYVRYANSIHDNDTYAPLVEHYLTSTLARRLDKKPVKFTTPWSAYNSANDIIALLTGAESVKLAAQSKVLLKNTKSSEAADQPLPKPTAVQPVTLPKFDPKIAIEPIAQHVPEECFYIRCGSFSNFQWLQDSIDQWGTYLRDVISVRGIDYKVNQRIQRQLAVKSTLLGKLLGDTVIADVAIVGTDTFLREGAAVGIIFQARSNRLLKSQIDGFRKDRMKLEKNATRKTVDIAGHKVDFLSTPDNAVRSYYAIDGKFHFVTTSKTLVKRFYEAGKGIKSLGKLDEFRWGRTKQPITEKQTVFIYLSDPFFRNLVSPHYRIEMTRRVAASAELDVALMAQLAAKAEGSKAKTIRELIDAGFLPAAFGDRPDGTSVVIKKGKPIDTLRGGRGMFLPITDVIIEGATPSEVKSYQNFGRIYQSAWKRMDPVVIGIKRKKIDGGEKERVSFNVSITPYAKFRYAEFHRMLGKADKLKKAVIADELISVDLNFDNKFFGFIPTGKYVAAVVDYLPRYEIKDGRVRYSTMKEDEYPFYLSTYGIPVDEFIKRMVGIDVKKAKKDKDGLIAIKAGLGIGLWYHNQKEFNTLALNKDIIKKFGPQLKMEPAERAAQLRIRIADLNGKKITKLLNAESFLRAYKTSDSNRYFFQTLTQQLHVPLEEATVVAEKLLGGEPVCALGKKYHLENGAYLSTWRSDFWEEGRKHYYDSYKNSVPRDYRSPLLDWFAGLSVEMNIDENTLSTYIELDVHKRKKTIKKDK